MCPKDPMSGEGAWIGMKLDDLSSSKVEGKKKIGRYKKSKKKKRE